MVQVERGTVSRDRVHAVLEVLEHARHVPHTARQRVPRVARIRAGRRVLVGVAAEVVRKRAEQVVVHHALAHVLGTGETVQHRHLRAPVVHPAPRASFQIRPRVGERPFRAERLAGPLSAHAARDVALAVDRAFEHTSHGRRELRIAAPPRAPRHAGVEVRAAYSVSHGLLHLHGGLVALAVRVAVFGEGALVANEVAGEGGVLRALPRAVPAVHRVRKREQRLLHAGMAVRPRALGRRAEHGVEVVGKTDCRVEVAAVASLREGHVPHRRLHVITLYVKFVLAEVDVVRVAVPRITIFLLAGDVVPHESFQDVGEVLPLRMAFEREHRRLRKVALGKHALHAESVPAVRDPDPFQTVEPVGPEARDLQRRLRHEPYLRNACGNALSVRHDGKSSCRHRWDYCRRRTDRRKRGANHP